MIDKPPYEQQAIKDARQPFAEALTELELMAPFFNRNAADIDRLIEACIDGFQDSMRRQSAKMTEATALNDELPW